MIHKLSQISLSNPSKSYYLFINPNNLTIYTQSTQIHSNSSKFIHSDPFPQPNKALGFDWIE